MVPSQSDLVQVRMELEVEPSASVQIAELQGREAISRLFELNVLAVMNGSLNTASLIGTNATLVFEREGKEVRRLHGMIASANDRLDTETQQSTYRFTIVPRAYRMALHETIDIFMDMAVPEIIEKKLSLIGLQKGKDYELRLQGTYVAREFVVQYKETDLAFISRLTEHYGISFCFEHDGRDIMVFSEGNVGFQPIASGGVAQFRPRGDPVDVFQLEVTQRLVPTKYIVRDYNYRTPQVDLTAEAEVKERQDGRVVEYGAHFKTPEEGAKIAQIRIEEQVAKQQVLVGQSDVPAMSAGAKFKLDGHPWGDLGLLITEVVHDAKQVALASGEGQRRYTNTFHAIPVDTIYRPPRVTPKPKVHGVLTGVIDAASAEKYAVLDDQGRYRVKLLYDTAESGEGQASRPIRMMQPHAGAGYGMHFPLRGGVEVLIVCIDGDPDRPIIAGTVPNPQTASPVVAGNAPRNIIRTGGNNEINIDDTEGSERIKLTTPNANTSFQLGAPNDPIQGISFKTDGHTSNAAIEGSSQWSTLSMQSLAFVNLLKSGNIVNVAAAPNLLALAAVGAGMFQSAVGGIPGGDAIYKANKSSIEQQKQNLFKKEAENNKLAIQASQDARSKQEECNLCKLKAKSRLPTTNKDPAVEQAIADYEAAANTCDDTFLSAIGTMEDRNGIIDAQRVNFLNDNFQPVMQRDAMAAVATYDYAKYKAVMEAQDEDAWNDLAEDKKAGITKEQFLEDQKARWTPVPVSDDDLAYQGGRNFDNLSAENKNAIPASVWTDAGIPEASVGSYSRLTSDQQKALRDAYISATVLDPPPDMKKVREDRRADMVSALDTYLANKDLSQQPYKGYDEYRTAMAGCVAKCGSELDAARASAVNTNDDYANLMKANTQALYDIQKLSNDNETAVVNYVNMGINALLALYALIEMFKARNSLIERWDAAKDIARNSEAMATTLGVYTKVKPTQIPFFRPQHTHVIGAEQSTEIYGQRDAIMWSETAMLLGMGSEEDIGWKAKLGAFAMAQLPGGPGATPVKAKGKAIVMGAEAAQLLSPTAVTIQAGWGPTEVNSKNRANIKLTTKRISMDVRNANNVASTTFAMSVDANNKGDIKLRTMGGAQQLDLNQHAKTAKVSSGVYGLEADETNQKTTLKAAAGYQVVLNMQATTAELLGGMWRLKLHEGNANGVTLGVDNAWRLKIKENEVDLGVHGGGAQLKLTNANSNLTAVGELALEGPNKITLTSGTVDFGGAAITSANLLVKADLANQPVITRLTAKVKGALTRAGLAMQEARQASATANQALQATQPGVDDID
jgi:type VI secretion system VgrG family protein